MKTLSTITAVAIMAGAAAQAAPVMLSYSDIISETDLDGTNVGDAFNIEIILDNGGSSLLSQTWDTDDFVSISVTTDGGYSLFGDMLNPLRTSNVDVQTDAGGMLSILDIDSLEFEGSDTNGQDFFEIFLNDNNNVLFYSDQFGDDFGPDIGVENTPNIRNTTISAVSEVPLPAGGLLLLGALGAFGAVRRKKAG